LLLNNKTLRMAEVKVEDIQLEENKPEFAVEPKLFGKWSYDGI